MKQNQILEETDTWICEDEFPQNRRITPIHKFGRLYPEDEEEWEAYRDFISWYLSQDYLPLAYIPKQAFEGCFETFEDDASISFPFSSMDYQRAHPFNRYAYKLRKVYENIKDLALMHSCISHDEGRANIHKKFVKLVNEEFRDRILKLLESYRKYPQHVDKSSLFRQIAELNGRIQRCKAIWHEHAYQE